MNREAVEVLSNIERWLTVLAYLGGFTVLLLLADGIGAAWEWWQDRKIERFAPVARETLEAYERRTTVLYDYEQDAGVKGWISS
jgi:hypothetical protein